MSELHDIEERLRQMKPSPAPADLLARLSAANPETAPRRHRSAKASFFAWAGGIGLAAACVALAFIRGGEAESRPEPIATAPLSIIQKDSTLLGTRTLGIAEHEGQLWEIAEQEWRDDTIALCSTSPVELRSAVNRREIVYTPIEFQ